MTEKCNDTHENIAKYLDKEVINQEYALFKNSIVRLNAASSIFKDGVEITEAEQVSRGGLNALNAEGGLQEMLVAQMLSIHQLQQQAISFANSAQQIENIRYFMNTAIKLANCFTQQANTLSRLQGNGNQKITVKHVEVHDGGQAVVGNIKSTSTNKVKT
jgi:hypothetical protein